MSLCLFVVCCRVMSSVARSCSLFFVCRSSIVVSCWLSFVVLCSVVLCSCVLLLLLLRTSVCHWSVCVCRVHRLRAFLLAGFLRDQVFFSLSSSSPSLSLTSPYVDSKRARVYVQNVPVHAGNTHTHVETCARGAGTHGDVLNVHTGTF